MRCAWLGWAFSIKFLYFAGGGRADYPRCIIDDSVGAALRAAGWAGLGGSGWSPRPVSAFAAQSAVCTRPNLRTLLDGPRLGDISAVLAAGDPADRSTCGNGE
ncbi:hypothetical protein [Nocardia sp. NPDC059691]|uniref:8-oxoguanine DNA glycosylase OGG fold protein n=1 Tax=Nocardia sp. NPDC059691 TaxID=3346908 RepID=UPI00367FF26A